MLRAVCQSPVNGGHSNGLPKEKDRREAVSPKFNRFDQPTILRLRRKLEPNRSEPALIRTERGAGYVFTAPVEIL